MGRPTFLSRVHQRGEALGPIPAAVVAADLDLEGRVGLDAVIAVDEVPGVGARHPGGLPAGAALPAEGQQVAEAVSVLVLPRHGLGGARACGMGEGPRWVRFPAHPPAPPSLRQEGRPRDSCALAVFILRWVRGEGTGRGLL